jgi:hypothetical protein
MLIINLGGDRPPIPPANNGKKIPDSRIALDDDDEDPTRESLFAILDRIDMAIHTNDDRSELSQIWHRCNKNVQPSGKVCNIVYTDNCELLYHLAERLHSTQPIIADVGLINGVRSTWQNERDFFLLGKSLCSRDGLVSINADIIALMNAYFNAFENMEIERDDLSQITDIFGVQLGEIVFDVGGKKTFATYEASKNAYKKAKQTIEKKVYDFQMTLLDYKGRISRLLAQRKAMRIGWGYKLQYPNVNFIVLIRYKPLSSQKAVEQGYHTRDKMWVPPIRNPNPNPESSTEIPRFHNHWKREVPIIKEDLNTPIEYVHNDSCVQEVKSLTELTEYLSTDFSSTFKILALVEDDLVFLEKINNLDNAFTTWLRTTSGWYPTRFNYEDVKREFQGFLDLCRNSNYDQKSRAKAIKEFTIFFQFELHTDLKWYYYPYHSNKSFFEYVLMYTKMIKT